MSQGYLERESERVNGAVKKRTFRLLIAGICLIAFIYILLGDSLDLNDPSNREVFYCFMGLTVILLLASISAFIRSRRPATGGRNLILPFGEGTREAVARVIDREAAEGQILVEEYIDESATGKGAHDQKIVLTPSYLLLCGNRWENKITAIPRDKIYWLCAQDGHKGGSFIVRLMIFTEKKIYTVDGTDHGHVHRIADQLYKYIPNIFSEYDPFTFADELEKLFTKDRAGFLDFYERAKRAEG